MKSAIEPAKTGWRAVVRRSVASHPGLRRWHGRMKAIWGARRLRRAVARNPLRLVLGASGFADRGWIPTDIQILDIRRPESWSRYLEPASVDAILAEHVWEHLAPDEGLTAARLCHAYLKPGGYLRIAVPDGLHPDPGYIELVRVGGGGAGADDHKVLYTYATLRALLVEAGFDVQLLEFFDRQGRFHATEWDVRDGKIHRSARFDRRNSAGVLRYTSIITDARKAPLDPARAGHPGVVREEWH